MWVISFHLHGKHIITLWVYLSCTPTHIHFDFVYIFVSSACISKWMHVMDICIGIKFNTVPSGSIVLDAVSNVEHMKHNKCMTSLYKGICMMATLKTYMFCSWLCHGASINLFPVARWTLFLFPVVPWGLHLFVPDYTMGALSICSWLYHGGSFHLFLIVPWGLHLFVPDYTMGALSICSWLYHGPPSICYWLYHGASIYLLLIIPWGLLLFVPGCAMGPPSICSQLHDGPSFCSQLCHGASIYLFLIIS